MQGEDEQTALVRSRYLDLLSGFEIFPGSCSCKMLHSVIKFTCSAVLRVLFGPFAC